MNNRYGIFGKIGALAAVLMSLMLLSSCESPLLQSIREASRLVYYMVFYDPNGATEGTVPEDDIKYNAGQTTEVLSNSGGLKKEGYNFAGWNTASDGNGQTYGSGSGLLIGTASVTLYAKWTQLPVYEVSFDSQGGSEVLIQEVAEGQLISQPSNPTRSGYSFAGWYKEISCTNSWNFSTDTVTTDRVLYAKWTGNLYSVIFLANDGSGSTQNQAVYFNEPVSLDPINFDRSGYSFSGWAITSNGIVVYADQQTYTHNITNDLILYAIWAPKNNYTSNNIGILLYTPGGSYLRSLDPLQVTEISGFFISKFEITQEQYIDVTSKSNPSNFNTGFWTIHPVEQVSWYDAIVFCNMLSLAEGRIPAYRIGSSVNPIDWGPVPTSSNSTWNAVIMDIDVNGYRLPTRGEWMWAAMGADANSPGQINTTGYEKQFSGDDGTNQVGDYAWYSVNSSSSTQLVGQRLSNELDLNDISGNVSEWLWNVPVYPDPDGPLVDPVGPSSGGNRMIVGGNWNTSIYSPALTVLDWSSSFSYNKNDHTGFRVVSR